VTTVRLLFSFFFKRLGIENKPFVFKLNTGLLCLTTTIFFRKLDIEPRICVLTGLVFIVSRSKLEPHWRGRYKILEVHS
jgi:hypothetical protein